MSGGDDLRARRFSQAVEQALTSAQRDESWVRDAKEAILASRATSVLLVAVLAALLLLVIRPPFVMRFEHDRRRPWRGSAHVAWRSVLATASLTAALALLLSP